MTIRGGKEVMHPTAARGTTALLNLVPLPDGLRVRSTAITNVMPGLVLQELYMPAQEQEAAIHQSGGTALQSVVKQLTSDAKL